MKRAPVYTDDMIPAGWQGSYHIGGDVYRQKCRECPETFDFPAGATCIQRYVGIGPHEVEAHGLQVAGINLGLLA